MNQRELPLLAGIGAFVTWCEELLAILSGPILTAGLAIALVDLLSDGALLAHVPFLLWVWAASQAVGLDAQFIGSAAKLARAIRRRAIWPAIGYIILCAALGYVGFLASNVFATQEANGISTAVALARLGMDSTSWILQRSLLAVALVFLSGFLRYVAPAQNVALSAEEERERLEADLLLEPLRQQKRALQLRGARGALDALRGKETPSSAETPPASSGEATGPSEPSETPPDRGPTGPGSPTKKPRQVEPVLTPAANVVPMQATRRRKTRRKVASNRAARGSVEPAVRAVFTPGMGTGELMRLSGVSKAAASKWRGILQAEADAAQQSNQAVQ